ncbi:MAG: hypothetical protein IJT50_04345 [Lentisphaeria bacterium]|nr:hypothetical protein [Lentisphaeria bacterium]
MSRSGVVLSGVLAAALGVSLIGNYYLSRRVHEAEGRAREAAGKGNVRKTAPELPRPAEAPAAAGSGAKSEKGGYKANLPVTPILFSGAEWSGGAVVIQFETESDLVSASAVVEPAIPFRRSISGSKLRLSGPFRPGTKYRVTVLRGAENEAGGKLEENAVTEIRIPDMKPEVNFVTAGPYLPLNGKKLALPFRTVNCDKVNVLVYKAFENNLNPYVIGEDSSDSRMILVADKEITFKTPKNREVFHELDLAELIGGRKPGVYRVLLNLNQRYVFVTDMAVQVAEDVQGGKLAVFVRSLSTGKPVAGAELTVMSYKNQLAASGRTDENGSALLTYDPAWNKESDYTVAVTARKAGDISFFRLLRESSRDCFQSRNVLVAGAPRAFVFAERGIARPGEQITASAFLRRDQQGVFKPMPDTVLEFRLVNPSGDTVLSSSVKGDAYGFAQTGFTLPETAPTGLYTISCRAAGDKVACGDTLIRVASFVPDRIKISGKALTESCGVGDAQDFEFDAKYYFGAPLENGSYQYSVATLPAAAPGHWGNSWHAGAEDRFVRAKTFSGKGRKGPGSVKIRYPGFAAQKGVAFDPVIIVASFEASEPGGRSVTGRVVKQLYPTPFFIGVREAESKGREKRFEYTLLPAVKSDRIPLPEKFEVTFELARKEWEYVLSRQGKKWKREWVRRVIPLPELKKTVSIPAGDFAVGKVAALGWDLPSGVYTLTVVSGQNYRTELDFYWYSGEGGERSADPNSLYFRTDAKQVAPGGTLAFSFDAPGSGEAFLVYGERSLAGKRIVPVKPGRNTVRMEIPKNIHSSSFYVGCTVVTRRGGTFLRGFGVLKINVDQTKAHRLAVGLEHGEKAEPESSFPVKVTLKDASGKPVSGEVCLYAVDSGVISLTNYRAPDIFDCFYGDIACPMTFYDMYGLLFDELKITPDGKIGGDGEGDLSKLGTIKQKHTARLIAPPVRVPASGEASVTVKLPEHTGQMTFFAVASSENAVGSTQRPVIMRKPVTVRISAPRFIAPGDEAELSLTVFNHEAEGNDGSCTVTLPPMLKMAGKDSNVFAVKGLGKGKQRTLTVRVRAEEKFDSGKIAARFSVGPAEAKDETFVTVRSVNAPQGVYRMTLLKPGESWKASSAGDFVGGTAGAIRLSASPALAVKNALDWLNDYPHGCLEQTTAGAFPFLSLPALAKAGLVDEAMARTNAHKVRGAYAKLLSMVLHNGSFAMWPGSDTPWEEGSVFALHFIFEAERRGLLSLDFPGRNRYRRWLTHKATFADPRRRSLRAYAAYVLAVAGHNSFLTASRNIIEGAKKPDFAVFLAGAALVKGGYASLGAPAMRDALAARCYLEEGVPTAFSDKACRLGMALYILMDCAIPGEELPTRLAVELSGSLRPDGTAWGTTQANAWAALGLAAYAEKFPPKPAQAEISVGGAKGEVRKISGAVTLPAKEGTTVVNRSAGTLIVESKITGVPRTTPPSGGPIRLIREYLNEKGEAVTAVRHGDKVRVRIRFETPVPIENLVITDLLPAGLEIEDELLATRAAILPENAKTDSGALCPKRLEKRDDRFLVFGDTAAGKGEITYRARAVIRGSFAIPPLHAEAMYQPDNRGLFNPAGRFTVR